MLKVTAVILAGGKSRRMGSDKAFLKVGREVLIQRVAGLMKNLFPEVLIAGNVEAGRLDGLKAVPDLIPGCGPLSGIHAGLVASSYPYCLVAACDMPFVSLALAKYLCERADGYDAVVPRHGDYLEPLFAVYGKTCLPPIEESLASARFKLVDFYSRIRVNYLDEREWKSLADKDKAFFNINTPRDLNKARSMISYNPGE